MDYLPIFIQLRDELAVVVGGGQVAARKVELLLKAGANPNAAQAEGETVLMTAARTGVPAAVKALLAHGADVNAKESWRGQSALMWAAAEGHADAEVSPPPDLGRLCLGDDAQTSNRQPDDERQTLHGTSEG